MTPYHLAIIENDTPLFLYKVDEGIFRWGESALEGTTPARAIYAAEKHWDTFRLVKCGMRYSLPVRDEVGTNAFFWQMAKSYASSNGHYFDEEAGHMCYVDFASEEALEIWRRCEVFV